MAHLGWNDCLFLLPEKWLPSSIRFLQRSPMNPTTRSDSRRQGTFEHEVFWLDILRVAVMDVSHKSWYTGWLFNERILFSWFMKYIPYCWKGGTSSLMFSYTFVEGMTTPFPSLRVFHSPAVAKPRHVMPPVPQEIWWPKKDFEKTSNHRFIIHVSWWR